MKRRIIGLILVVVMLALSLASCGTYSIASDDLSAYATFSEADKATFEKLLEKIAVEDGDFTNDEAIRARKVMENIYSALAKAAGTDDKQTEGAVSAHDIVYYSHYVTAVFDGKTEYFFATEMKDSNADKVQLGIEDTDDTMLTAMRAAFSGLVFGEGGYTAYTSSTSGTTEAGNVVFVTYSYSYKEIKDGAEVEKSGKVTNGMLVVSSDTNTLEGKFLNKTVGSSIDNFTLTDATLGEVSYTDVKVNWIANGTQYTEFKDITYDEDKNVTNTSGQSRNLKNVELTYHVYPVSYIAVEEFSATSVINTILGSKITADAVYNMLFGAEYTGLHEDHDGHNHTEEEEKENDEKLAELNEWLKAYETTDVEGKTVTLADLVEKLAKEQDTLDDAKDTLDEEQEDYDEAKAAYDKKKTEVDAAGDSATEAQKTELAKLQSAMDIAKEALDKAQTAYNEALAARDASTSKLLSFDGIEDKITAGYRRATYDSLQDAYNKEIRMNMAKEIYFFLTEYVKVTGTPEKAVEATYKQLIENYENDFYTGTFDSTNKISNYKQYGTFKKFLVEKVSKDIKKVATYKEALAAVKEHAKTYVEPVVMIYTAAKAYGDDVFVTDKEFEEYKKSPESNYSYNEYYYGENSVRYAHQFDELMNFFLQHEEVKAESADANGYTKVTIKYTNETVKVGYEIGEPLSEKESGSEAE